MCNSSIDAILLHIIWGNFSKFSIKILFTFTIIIGYLIPPEFRWYHQSLLHKLLTTNPNKNETIAKKKKKKKKKIKKLRKLRLYIKYKYVVRSQLTAPH